MPLHEELVAANRERVHLPELRPLLQIRRQRGEAPFGYFNHFGGLRRLAGRGSPTRRRRRFREAGAVEKMGP